MRGDADRAFAALAAAAKIREITPYVVVETDLRPLHGDQRWLPFLERLGLSPKQLSAIEFKVELPR